MAKGDDSIQREKNKLARKKLHQKEGSSSVSARVASIIASKKRRQSGKRRMCQGFDNLDQVCTDRNLAQSCRKVVLIVWKDKNLHKLVATLKKKGYSISGSSTTSATLDKNSVDGGKGRREVAVVDAEPLANADDLEEWEVVLMPDFVPSIDTYVRVLTNMARYSVYGMLHSFVSEENWQLVSL